MKKGFIINIFFLLFATIALVGCQSQPVSTTGFQENGGLKVIAAESFLADIAQNVAGDRFNVSTLIPLGMDPHAFEPIPRDVAALAESDIVIINGGGIEGWLEEVIANSGGKFLVIEASAGLESREVHHAEEEHEAEDEGEDGHHHENGDPHFWLDPINVIHYVENIRDGFIEKDPTAKDIYTRNAENYIKQLNELDVYIRQQVEIIPAGKRLIITNHESFGYYADRYGFTVVGTIIPSVSTGSSPSAQQLVRLVDDIHSTGVTAIFLETGTNPQLAEQISSETGIKVVSDLYTHSITEADGVAPTYIDMMKYNTNRVVENLK